MRSLLLSSLSHDLRTPLTAMAGGFSSLLRRRKALPRDVMEELTTLWGQHERLQRFVDNLLRMAAVTSDRLKLNRQPYMVQEIIGAALTRFDSRKGMFLTVMTGTLPLTSLDGAMIENALRYTPEGGIITIGATVVGPAVSISVSDTGARPAARRSGTPVRPFRKRRRARDGQPVGGEADWGLRSAGRSLRLTVYDQRRNPERGRRPFYLYPAIA